MEHELKLNLGCGQHPIDGWTNVDRRAPCDVMIDFDGFEWQFPYGEGTVDEFYASHLLEHLWDPLYLMAECWRVAREGARFVARCPYGSSDDADEDPTHVRRLFLQSWGYFGQPYHWRGNEEYGGDWQVYRIWLVCTPGEAGTLPSMADVMGKRNVVREMCAELRAVKPRRPRERMLQEQPIIAIVPQ